VDAPKLSRRERDYQGSLRSAARGLWGGTYGFYNFLDEASRSIEYHFTRAWEEGLASCGILPSEQTPEESARLRYEINSEIGYLYDFGEDIAAEDRSHGGKLRAVNQRLSMWVNKYGMIKDLAMSYACADRKLMWTMNVHCREHCTSCLKLSGHVYRASTWRKYNIYPRMPSLQCGGFHCCCEFIETNEPISPGRPISTW